MDISLFFIDFKVQNIVYMLSILHHLVIVNNHHKAFLQSPTGYNTSSNDCLLPIYGGNIHMQS